MGGGAMGSYGVLGGLWGRGGGHRVMGGFMGSYGCWGAYRVVEGAIGSWEGGLWGAGGPMGSWRGP